MDYLPMLAKDWAELIIKDWQPILKSKFFWDKDYIAEIKYDGSRYILSWDRDGKVKLTSRTISVKTGTPTDKTENLRGYLYDDTKTLADTVLDWEIVVRIDGKFLKNNGSSEVNKIMLSKPLKCKNRLKVKNIEVFYMVYDCIKFKWEDISNEPLIKRKQILEDVLVVFDNKFGLDLSKRVHLVHPLSNEKKTYTDVIGNWFEGIMLKKLDSIYEQGKRSNDWRKIKKVAVDDGIIMWANKWTWKYSNTMWALSIGQFFKLKEGVYNEDYFNTLKVENNEIFCVMIWATHLFKDWEFYELREVATISGMTDEFRKEFWEKMKGELKKWIAIKTDKGIFYYPENIKKSKVVEFLYQEKTKSRYRHPRYIQNREDKPMSDCLFLNN